MALSSALSSSGLLLFSHRTTTTTTRLASRAAASAPSSCRHGAPVGLGLGLPSCSSVPRRSHNSPSRMSNGSFSLATSRCSIFMQGEAGSIFSILPQTLAPIKERRPTCPRAAEDVPSYKGFPPMTEKPKWYWRILACVPYLMPLSETWMYAETAYSLFSFLEDYEFCTYPFLILIGSLPGWFLLAYFFGAYLGIVRNNRWPHFLRFHVVTGMLLEIILQVMGTINDWVPQSVYWGKIGAHYWLAVSMAFFFIVVDCIRCALNGMYADVPFLSDASYMQIPYE
ncbi:unnamed protein product [Calypogeia fissa]